MADVRQLVASAISGADLTERLLEAPLDRIAALAFTDRLGSLLWRLKWANDPTCFAPAVALLARRVARKHDHKVVVRRVCDIALREWLDEVCRGCSGRKFIMASAIAPKHTCTVCNGTGKRRPSELERMRGMGFSQSTYRKWVRKFDHVANAISDADTEAWRQVSLQLSRMPRKKTLANAIVKNTISPRRSATRELASTATPA